MKNLSNNYCEDCEGMSFNFKFQSVDTTRLLKFGQNMSLIYSKIKRKLFFYDNINAGAEIGAYFLARKPNQTIVVMQIPVG